MQNEFGRRTGTRLANHLCRVRKWSARCAWTFWGITRTLYKDWTLESIRISRARLGKKVTDGSFSSRRTVGLVQCQQLQWLLKEGETCQNSQKLQRNKDEKRTSGSRSEIHWWFSSVQFEVVKGVKSRIADSGRVDVNNMGSVRYGSNSHPRVWSWKEDISDTFLLEGGHRIQWDGFR